MGKWFFLLAFSYSQVTVLVTIMCGQELK